MVNILSAPSRPLIPIVLALCLGIIAGYEFPEYHFRIYLLFVICLLFIIRQIMIKRVFFLIFYLPVFCVGYLSIYSLVLPVFPQNHITNYTGYNKYIITGVIDSSPLIYEKRTKFFLNTELLDHDNEEIAVTGKIRVTVSGRTERLCYGDRIQFKSRIRRFKNFNNPGGFNYVKYMCLGGIHASTYTREYNILIIEKETINNFYKIIEKARKCISIFIDESVAEDHKAVLKALITGQKHGIHKKLREIFNRAGTGHLLAISGLHIGIIAFASFSFFFFSINPN